MKKSVALFGLSLMIPVNVMAQEPTVEDLGLGPIDSCTGTMTSAGLIKTSQELLKAGDEASDFFATNCVMIAAHKGDADAQYMLSGMYKDGVGAPISTVYAYKWAKIAELNGKKIDEAEFEKMESSMNVDDFKQSSLEISSYISFEKKQGEKLTKSNIKNILENLDYANLSPETLAAIEESAKSIDALFTSDTSEVDTQKKKVEDLQKKLRSKYESDVVRQSSSSINDDRSRRIQEEMDRRRMEEQQHQQQQRSSASKTTTNSRYVERAPASTGVQMPKGLDFNTDKYNPGFSPPTTR